MEKDNSQLELFSRTKDSFESKTTASRPFLCCVRGHEKAILIVICLIVSSVVSFSLGFERGRKSIVSGVKDLNIEVAAKAPAVEPKLQARPQEAISGNAGGLPKVEIQKQERAGPTSIQAFDNFTIQLASYQTITGAQKEAERLKKKGLVPVILTKGKYSILCVGNFRNKESAKQVLAELKKRYKDCFIRRM